jgi:hypothetical protein
MAFGSRWTWSTSFGRQVRLARGCKLIPTTAKQVIGHVRQLIGGSVRSQRTCRQLLARNGSNELVVFPSARPPGGCPSRAWWLPIGIARTGNGWRQSPGQPEPRRNNCGGLGQPMPKVGPASQSRLPSHRASRAVPRFPDEVFQDRCRNDRKKTSRRSDESCQHQCQ